MFGFSFMKLLVLAAIITAVWYGFKMMTKITEDRKDRVDNLRKSASRPTTEDMVACPECGTFVAANSSSKCERANCPY